MFLEKEMGFMKQKSKDFKVFKNNGLKKKLYLNHNSKELKNYNNKETKFYKSTKRVSLPQQKSKTQSMSKLAIMEQVLPSLMLKLY